MTKRRRRRGAAATPQPGRDEAVAEQAGSTGERRDKRPAEEPERAAGEDAPEQRGSAGHSGRLLLRMPSSLHAELARAADTEGISLNQFITTALASAVGWRNEAADADQARDSANGKPSPASGASPADGRPRGRNVLLVLNLIVLLVVAALAILLLVAAYDS